MIDVEWTRRMPILLGVQVIPDGTVMTAIMMMITSNSSSSVTYHVMT